jgi:hypothetical protein
LNADFDWAYRILKTTAYKIQTDEKKLLMAKTIVEICESAPDVLVPILSNIMDIVCVNDNDRLAISKEMASSSSKKSYRTFKFRRYDQDRAWLKYRVVNS